MIQKIRERIFPYLITITALAISFIAAYVSVIGLSKLFVGAETTILIIASILEFSKVIIASILYSYRKTLALLLKIYLIIALVVLMTITSVGIYGFLSGAYSETSSRTEQVDKELKIYEVKNNRFIDTRNNLIGEKQFLDESINSLRNGLSNNKTQYKDRETGEIITTTSSSNRKSLEQQLATTISSKGEIELKIQNITDSISKNELKILEIESKSELSKELGPLKYISKITGREMDSVVNWLMILLMIVFDPLAICLVITSNFTFEQLKRNPDTKEITDNGDWRNSTNEEIQEIMDNVEINPSPPEPPQERIIKEGEQPTPPQINEGLSTFRKKRIEKDGDLGKVY